MTSAVGNAIPWGADYLGDVMHDVWQPLRALSRVFYADLFGAVPDSTGVTDSSIGVAAAMLAAAQNGGTVVFGPGQYNVQPQLTYPGVYVRGAGVNSTTIKLLPGSNADLFNAGAANLALINVTNTSFGTGNTGGLSYWGFSDLTLDGNKANQSGVSYCLRVYGLNFSWRNANFRNGLSGGCLVDWNGGNGQAATQDGIENFIVNCKFQKNGGIGFTWGGPHDSMMSNCEIGQNSSHNLYIGPHNTGPLIDNIHAWGSGLASNSVAILCEGNAQFSNSVAEGSDTAQLVLLASTTFWQNGFIYGSLANPATGIQVGQIAGGTPYAGSAFQSAGLTTAVPVANCMIQCKLNNLTGTNGVVNLVNEGGGHNYFDLSTIWGSAGSFFSANPNATDKVTVVSNNTAGAPNMEQFPGTVQYSPVTNIPTTGSTVPTANNAVVQCNPAGAVTGLILDNASAKNGMTVLVENKSANQMSWATAATSHVLGELGGTFPLAANTAMWFVYDGPAAAWVHVA